MIQSFADSATEQIFLRSKSLKKISKILQRMAMRKLVILDAADSLDDLRAPPGNRLEKLTGDRAGQYSIRINDQWRICFRWDRGDAFEVEMTDYH